MYFESKNHVEIPHGAFCHMHSSEPPCPPRGALTLKRANNMTQEEQNCQIKRDGIILVIALAAFLILLYYAHDLGGMVAG